MKCYCESNEVLLHTNKAIVSIQGDRLCLYTKERSEKTGEIYHGIEITRAVGVENDSIVINYCPVCGRRLQ